MTYIGLLFTVRVQLQRFFEESFFLLFFMVDIMMRFYLQILIMVRFHGFVLLLIVLDFISLGRAETSHRDQPLLKIAIHKAVVAIHKSAYIKVSPSILGSRVTFDSHVCCFFLFCKLFFLIHNSQLH